MLISGGHISNRSKLCVETALLPICTIVTKVNVCVCLCISKNALHCPDGPISVYSVLVSQMHIHCL